MGTRSKGGSKGGVKIRVPRHVRSASQPTIEYLLEQTDAASIKAARERTDAYIQWAWNHYSELAFQRQQIASELQAALGHACRPFKFQKWQRAVRYKYGHHPMSTVGSTMCDGARFNYGRDINTQLVSFPALYIANDRETALLEALGQPREGHGALSPHELTLANPQSETIVSVSGEMDEIVDLVDAAADLNNFIDLIKGFTLSKPLLDEAKRFNLSGLKIIESVDELVKSLLDPNWRRVPVTQDVPANCQIFGHIVREAGIAGIRYPSKMTERSCVALFPSNFCGTTCYIELDDEPPALPGAIQIPRRYDESNATLCDLTADALFQLRH